MSSFTNPHQMYLFSMKNGKKKLAYGIDPADAWEVLNFRLSADELEQVIRDEWIKISPRDIQQYVHLIG